MAPPKRKPNRLPNYDYSQTDYYFIILCTKDKQPLFQQSSVGADVIRPPQGVPLSSIGRVVDEAIHAIPAHHPSVTLDKFIVMSNYIHLILALAEPDGRMVSIPTKPLSAVIGSIKQTVVKRASIPLWQKPFHDHVIRDEVDYQCIWNYVDVDPRKWREDCYYI